MPNNLDSTQSVPIVEITDLSKTYANGATVADPADLSIHALYHVSLSISQGEWVSLLGPSGSGKTTLLNIIAGLEVPSSGKVLHDGKQVCGPSADRGMLFQEYALFPWKRVLGNVEFGLRYGSKGRGISREEQDVRARELIRLVGLEGAEEKYPSQLSGGMKQRCALARLLAYDPEILLMDEPLAAVDAQTRAVLQDELLRIWGQMSAQRKTVVYVTHSIEEAVYLSDRVVVLSRSPGQVKSVFNIDLDRPRIHNLRSSQRYRELVERAWELVRDEAIVASMEIKE